MKNNIYTYQDTYMYFIFLLGAERDTHPFTVAASVSDIHTHICIYTYM